MKSCYPAVILANKQNDKVVLPKTLTLKHGIHPFFVCGFLLNVYNAPIFYHITMQITSISKILLLTKYQ